MGEIMTAKQVAELLKVSVWSVYELVKRGQLQAFKVGRKIRFSSQAVEAFVNSGGCHGV